jgi:subtilisin family serine protease
VKGAVRAGAAALLAGLALAIVPAAAAEPGRVAIGVDGRSADEVAAIVEQLTGSAPDRSLEAIGAMTVRVPDVAAAIDALAEAEGVAYVETVTRKRSLAFIPNDPLTSYQWYLDAVQAFSYWDLRPALAPVRVAIIDSGIDASHPEFAGRVVEARSFVPGENAADTIGHGTLVAGEVGAALDNGEGIAGVGFPAELLVAKVVAPDGSISLEAEAKAIRWAVDRGARVINLSLGGLRDPRNPTRDQYSALEQSAIEYARSNGVVVVAAAGNCELPGECPYPYASYPAALSHVIGVGALNPSAGVPSFSNRDLRYVDLGAPGVQIVSTFPFDLTYRNCDPRGYSLCASNDLIAGNGTSFSAPLVTAAATLLLSLYPNFDASQVTNILGQTATDVGGRGRDAGTGNGRLNIRDALGAAAVPSFPFPRDRHETNDDAGLKAQRLYGNRPALTATIDYFDDPDDVYAVYVRAGQRLRVTVDGPKGQRPTIVLWRPGTTHVTAVTQVARRTGKIIAFRTAPDPILSVIATRTGWHYVDVKAQPGRWGPYRLVIRKTG